MCEFLFEGLFIVGVANTRFSCDGDALMFKKLEIRIEIDTMDDICKYR